MSKEGNDSKVTCDPQESHTGVCILMPQNTRLPENQGIYALGMELYMMKDR